MSKRDYYEVLGVSKDADNTTIKKAYRKLAMKFHPDRNQDNKEASESKFKEINEAYAVLSDEEKRQNYDRFGHEGMSGNGFSNMGGFDFGGGGFDFGDIFGSFFGGGNRQQNPHQKVKGQDQLQSINISFQDTISGTSFTVKPKVSQECDECDGSGGRTKADVVQCDSCHGKGQVDGIQRTPLGNIRTSRPCNKCRGSGEFIKNKCRICRGKKFIIKIIEKDVKIPPGINTGQRLRLSGMGGVSHNGGPNGDLYLEIHVSEHKYFKRKHNDIYLNIPVTIEELVLGTSKSIPTPYGEIKMKIPPKTDNLQKFRIKNKGMPILNAARFGNLYVIPEIIIQKDLSRKSLKLFKELEKENSYKEYKDFLKKVKN